MASLKLSKAIKDQLVAGNHHAPRAVLGFHEVTDAAGQRTWLVRALEPDASGVALAWDGDTREPPAHLTRIHDGGLFELTCAPRPALAPYHLIVEYADGTRLTKHDAYFFAPQVSDFDLHLFAEGNHHRIYLKLGAHPVTHADVRGTQFAVWAPNAARVSVVG